MSTSLFVGLALVVAAPAVKDPPKKDAPTLVGTWTVESALKGGKLDNMSGPGTLAFTADGKVTLSERGKDITGTYTSDPKKNPSELDLTLDAGGAQITMPGIFKFEKDTLMICLTFMGDRPKEFTSPDGAMVVLITLKRAKKE